VFLLNTGAGMEIGSWNTPVPLLEGEEVFKKACREIDMV